MYDDCVKGGLPNFDGEFVKCCFSVFTLGRDGIS
jgi:hypothetical protein